MNAKGMAPITISGSTYERNWKLNVMNTPNAADGAVVRLDENEARGRHCVWSAVESTKQPAHERRLSGSEVTFEEDHVAGVETLGELAGRSLRGLGGCAGGVFGVGHRGTSSRQAWAR